MWVQMFSAVAAGGMGYRSSQFSLIQHFSPPPSLAFCKRLPFTQEPIDRSTQVQLILPKSKGTGESYCHPMEDRGLMDLQAPFEVNINSHCSGDEAALFCIYKICNVTALFGEQEHNFTKAMFQDLYKSLLCIIKCVWCGLFHLIEISRTGKWIKKM